MTDTFTTAEQFKNLFALQDRSEYVEITSFTKDIGFSVLVIATMEPFGDRLNGTTP